MPPSRTTEQSQSDRYPAPDGAQLLITSGQYQATGFLVDIGPRGAAFEYIFLDERVQEGDRIDILADQEALEISDVPFEIAFDIEVDPVAPEPVIWRRCDVRFTSLSKEQSRRLDALLRHWGCPVPQGAPSTPVSQIDDDIFLARLKLLYIAAKAYGKGYPWGFYRRHAITRNAGIILGQLPCQKVFRFGESHSPVLEKHIAMLAEAFGESPPASMDPAALEHSINFVGHHLRGDKSLTQMAFLRVA